MTEEEINKAIARVILSTKRKNRQFSLFEIANDINALSNAKGGLKEVANTIGISTGMLNQFLSVFKLPKTVIELVKNRNIDSVSMVHYLTKFDDNDSVKLSKLLASNKLSSQDLRILIPYRKQHKEADILDLVEKIHASKNIKVSVIRINKQDTIKSTSELHTIFSDHVGAENVIMIDMKNEIIDIKLAKEGEKILRDKAKTNNTTFVELISKIIH